MSSPRWSARPLRAGDHIRRRYPAFNHHGIYIGSGWVIHLSGENGPGLDDPDSISVRKDPLEKFSRGAEIEVCEYGFFDRLKRRGAKKTVKIAESRLGERGYDPIHYNCEHFCNLCIFGKPFSSQIDALRAKVNVRKGSQR